MRASWRAVIGFGALLIGGAGCTFNPTIPAGRVSCHANSDCRPGFICTDHPALPAGNLVCCASEHCAHDTGVVLPAIGGTDGGKGDVVGSGGTDGAAPIDQRADGSAGGFAGTGGADAASDVGDDLGQAGTSGSGGGPGTGGSGVDGGPVDMGMTCPPGCTVGVKQCGANGGVQTCGTVNGCTAWSPESPCPSPQTCHLGACQCPAPPSPCAQGAGTFCASNTVVGTCVVDGLGCVSMAGAGTTCPAGKPCTGQHPSANCSCPPAPAACATGAGSSCQNNTQITCVLDASGCLAVSAMVTCPASKPCAGNAPNATCTCLAPPSDCGGPGTVCRPNNVLATCGKNSDGCLVTASTVTCPGIKTCSGFQPNAACVCPAAPAGCNGQSSGSFCQSTSTLAVCAADANGCVVATASSCAHGCTGTLPGAMCCVATPGQTCGACGGVTACDGSCSKPLAADCAGKACGASDGCGGFCNSGTCPAGQTCAGSPAQCITPTTKPLLVGAANGASLKAYNAQTGAAAPDFVSGGPTISGASALAYGGPSKNLFVKGWSFPAHSIQEYDGRTGVFVRTLVASGVNTPGADLILGPDGSLYTDDSNGNIARWDPATGASKGVFIAKGTALDALGGLRFGPDGNLYVGSYTYAIPRHQILRFDATGGGMTVFVPPGTGGLTGPVDFVFSPDGASFFVASQGSNQILRFDGHSGAFIGAIPSIGVFGLAYGPDANLYASISNGNTYQVSRLNGVTGVFISLFAANTNPVPTYLLFVP